MIQAVTYLLVAGYFFGAGYSWAYLANAKGPRWLAVFATIIWPYTITLGKEPR